MTMTIPAAVRQLPHGMPKVLRYAFLAAIVIYIKLAAMETHEASRAITLNVIDNKKKSLFICPIQVVQSSNIVESFGDEYSEPAKKKAQNLTYFLENFRTMEIDGWVKNYGQVEKGMQHWRSTRFVPNVRSGDTIYESACGIGMGLHMTVDILKQHGIENLTVYGNEYLPESADLANKALDFLLPKLNARKGAICQGDSTDLSHVPDNSFDLVYTGYLSELYDTLNLNLSENELYARNEQLCRSKNDDWKALKLLEIGEARQSEWHKKWVGEMIRIAKPGKAIIIEQARESDCKAHPGFDVPTRGWWREAIRKCQWDVDPDSLDFEEDRVFRHRYHLLMKKSAPIDKSPG